tara:strand:- start:670 stop:1599 length:930 start_codon:yes stop_codon:yes gene_type:complete
MIEDPYNTLTENPTGERPIRTFDDPDLPGGLNPGSTGGGGINPYGGSNPTAASQLNRMVRPSANMMMADRSTSSRMGGGFLPSQRFDPELYLNQGMLGDNVKQYGLGGFFRGLGKAIVSLPSVAGNILDTFTSFVTNYDDEYYQDRGVVDEDGNKIYTINPDGSINLETGQEGTTNLLGQSVPGEFSGLQVVKPGMISKDPLPAVNRSVEMGEQKDVIPTAERRVVNPFGLNAYTGSGDATATESNPYGKQDLDNPYIRENVNVFNKGGMVDKEMTYEGSGSFSELANRVIAKNQIKKIRQRFTNGGIF